MMRIQPPVEGEDGAKVVGHFVDAIESVSNTDTY